MALNRLDRPIEKAKGSGNCCCGSCKVNVGCPDNSGLPSQVMNGRCCKCVPRRICVSVEAYGGCECAPYGASFVPVEAEWSCLTNSWVGSIGSPGAGSFDFAIGFEHPIEDGLANASKCFIALSSQALGLLLTGVVPDDYTDTRIKIPLVECDEYYYGDLKRSKACQAIDVAFDIDLAAVLCAYGYESESCPARLLIREADYVARPAKYTGFWDGYEDCRYTRICLTYTDPYGAKQRHYVCQNDYGIWELILPNTEGQENFVIQIVPQSFSPTILSLTTYGVLDYPVTATCPHMKASWELGSGATISVVGDFRADCGDCRCWPRCLCVRYGRSDQGSQWEGELCWDDYYGGWSGEIQDITLAEAEPITISLALICDECTGETRIEWTWRETTHSAAIECPDIIGMISVSDPYLEDVDEGLEFSGKKCAPCFSAPGTIACCGGEFPTTLTATFEPFDDGTDEMVRDCPGATGSISLQFFPFDETGNIGLFWRGFGFPFEGCPTKRVGLQLECPFDGQARVTFFYFNLGDATDVNDGIIIDGLGHAEVSCDPILISFISNLGLVASEAAACCGIVPWDGFAQYNFKISITE